MSDLAEPVPGVAPARVRHPATGYLLYLVAACLFALNGTISKSILLSGIDPARLSQRRVGRAFLIPLVAVGITRPSALRVRRTAIPVLPAFATSGIAMTQSLSPGPSSPNGSMARMARSANAKTAAEATCPGNAVLGSGPINHTIEASKWRTYRAEMRAAKAGCPFGEAQDMLCQRISVRDGSHLDVPRGFDQNGPLQRRIGLKYRHIPAPLLLALGHFASNLDGVINRS